MTHMIPARRSLILVCAAATALSLSSCALSLGGSSQGGAAASQEAVETSTSTGAGTQASASGAAPSSTASATASGPTVPGYAVGEMPPVPLFALPDISVLTDSGSAFTPDLTRSIASVPGITVTPARCDQPGVLASSTTVLGEDSITHSSDSGSVTNHGDGSGTYSDGQVSITNHGDGSGTYTNGQVSMTVHGDGSGTYSDAALSVTVHGDGSGTYSNSLTGESITIHGDGSGTYSAGKVSITNHGDGSGVYNDGTISIVNYGDGSGLVNTEEVSMRPLAKVGSIGDFPTIDAVKPVTSCGTVITLEDGVLFDFGSAQVRPDAATTLGNLATVLRDSGAPSIQIHGHTDSVSDDAFNQTLSEDRARAVMTALQGDGVSASMEATGYGETRPVAANENPDGSDNPAGRQLNRRVEVFIPAF
ncbi:OmpA family protein [Actinomyces bowdenii]|uniref:OmpA family protein n=1 Tax=Actinomyces bowdenii TaxID=131109 RepID=A0A3P1UNS6_9ACTO|nr:OmpA family protein [Actinomyces bowdenii]RRD22835.1 OmpA family protein [Actinomyces bowdenii]